MDLSQNTCLKSEISETLTAVMKTYRAPFITRIELMWTEENAYKQIHVQEF